MKSGVMGKQLEIDQKMSLREKQRARRKAEDEEDRLLFEQTGIKDKSKDFTMENLIKKYNYDMSKYEKKLKKIEQLEKAGQPYDADDIKLSDDEEGDYIERQAEERLRQKREYDDEYLKAKEEEKENMEKQFESIERRLSELKAKNEAEEGAEEGKSEMESFREYEELVNEMSTYGDYYGK
jgi:hypothetical protein